MIKQIWPDHVVLPDNGELLDVASFFSFVYSSVYFFILCCQFGSWCETLMWIVWLKAFGDWRSWQITESFFRFNDMILFCSFFLVVPFWLLFLQQLLKAVLADKDLTADNIKRWALEDNVESTTRKGEALMKKLSKSTKVFFYKKGLCVCGFFCIVFCKKNSFMCVLPLLFSRSVVTGCRACCCCGW